MQNDGRRAVTHCRPQLTNYDPLAWADTIRRSWRLVVLVLALVLAMAPLISLDGAKVQLLGWVLYPIESALNAVFFPGVATPVRGNGTALLVLAPTVSLVALLVAAVRSVIVFVHGALERLSGRTK